MNRKLNRVFLLIAILLYIPLGLLQVKINYRRTIENLESRMLLMPGQMAGSLVLSGFRGIAADLLWLNIEDYWHKGQHYKMLPLFDAVSWLQPEYVTVWAVGGWHMAYNIFADIANDSEATYKKFKEMVEGFNSAEKREIQRVIDIVDGARKMKEDLSAYYNKWLKEKEIPEGKAQITRYMEELKKFEGNKKYQNVIETAKVIVSIPLEQIKWYENGIKFLKKGVSYNPEKYDVYFELGWTYYHKGQDYPNAVKYLEKAVKFPHPAYVDNVLAHSYELNGQVDKALEQWEKQLKSGNFTSIAERAIRCIKQEGAFNPKRRKMLGIDKD
ncbi:MAG: hypothetical protein N3D17_03205 [bacterium]|nr:hypothetical protein [bacterium]